MMLRVSPPGRLMWRSMVKRMAMRIGSGLSTDPDVRLGAIEAAAAAREAHDGDPADLAVVFACGSHLAAPEATLEGVHEALAPRTLIGCGAGGVLGDGREIEDGTAVAVWAASLDDGVATPFHAEASGGEDGGVVFSGVPELSDAAGVILLPDPFSFPTDRLLRELAAEAPGVPVVGGISSARTLDGSS